MIDRMRQLPDAPPWRHSHATLDVEGAEADFVIVESPSAEVETIDCAVVTSDWAEQHTGGGSRWSAGTIPVNPHTAALMAGKLGEEVGVMPPGPARREKLRQMIAYGGLALALDGAP